MHCMDVCMGEGLHPKAISSSKLKMTPAKMIQDSKPVMFGAI